MVLGALLVSSSILAPWGLIPEDDPVPANLSGTAEFVSANYTGPATVHAQQAALRALGSFDVDVRAEQVSLTVVERHRATVGFGVNTPTSVDPATEQHVRNPVDSRSHETFTDAHVRLQGTPDALLELVPNQTVDRSSFRLNLSANGTPTVRAALEGIDFLEGDEPYRYDGPVFALGHGTDDEKTRSVEQAVFATFDATGALNVVVDGGTIEVQEENTTHTFATRDRWSQQDPSGHATVEHQVFAIITLEGARASMGFAETDALFYSPEPRWQINGSLEFQALDGKLQTGGTNRSLENSSVQIDGETTLDLKAHDRSGFPLEPGDEQGIRALAAAKPQPSVEASMDSQARQASVDGQSIEVPDAPAVPEEVTFWGKIVGLLLLAWSVGKKLLTFTAALAIDNPLDNPRRERIYEFVAESGMAHLAEIQRATGIPLSSVAYHLKILKRKGLLASVKENGYTVYFPRRPELSHEEMERLALLAHETRRDIAHVLVAEEHLTQADLAEMLEVSRSTVSRQLSRLLENDLVTKEGQQNISYRPSHLLERWFSLDHDSFTC